MPACPECGRDYPSHRPSGAATCGDHRCQAAARQKRLDRARRDAAVALGQPRPEAFSAHEIPVNLRALRPTPEAMKRAFERHLDRIVEEAAAAPLCARAEREPPPIEHEPSDLLLPICATCRGACCDQGQHTGMLRAASIRRVAAANPGETLEAIRARYLAMVPAESYADSCLFHTDRGCALPRDLRSDTCNTHLCRPVADLVAALEGERRPTFVAAVQDERVHRSAFVGPGGRGIAERDLSG